MVCILVAAALNLCLSVPPLPPPSPPPATSAAAAASASAAASGAAAAYTAASDIPTTATSSLGSRSMAAGAIRANA